MARRGNGVLWSVLVVTVLFFVWSAIHPKDRFTWFLETFPVILGALILVPTYRRFPLSNLVYVLLAIHGVILMVGGKYTYAEVPLGFWMQRVFGFTRNHYDRIGHFAQGFVPAMVAREVLVRNRVLRRGAWLFTFVFCICLSISALYELLEWSVAVGTGTAADAFLGTQGDPWDTQEDMATAAIGAILAQLVLSRWHDRSMEKVDPALHTETRAAAVG